MIEIKTFFEGIFGVTYGISQEEWLTPLDNKPTSFSWRERVVRRNAISFYAATFAASVGEPVTQAAAMEWARLHLQTDYISIIDNLRSAKELAGSWGKVLRGDEIAFFCEQFRKVLKHWEKLRTIVEGDDDFILTIAVGNQWRKAKESVLFVPRIEEFLGKKIKRLTRREMLAGLKLYVQKEARPNRESGAWETSIF